MKLTSIAVAFLLLAGCTAPRQWEAPREHYHKELSVEVRESGDGRPQVVATFKITN
jgi:uncharacterized lipoprotein YajG